jgi:glutamyl-tRNA reductase
MSVGTASSTPTVIALTSHARRVPAVERERFGEQLRSHLVDRGLILETCHRVEAFAVVEPDDRPFSLAFEVPDGGALLSGPDAVRHAITVAVGRDSVVAGEDQILHQLRAAVDAAKVAGTLDPTLERLFAAALRAGRRARSWRQGPQRSLADLALSVMEERIGSLTDRSILVVGAGRMGRLAGRAAAAAGVLVAVANRTTPSAEALATSVGGRTEPFDPGPGLARFAGVIVALGGPWPIGAASSDALARSTTVVVDLSVPTAVPATVAEAIGARLITADALALIDDRLEGSRDSPPDRIDALIDQTTEEFLAWQGGRAGRTAAQALVERADRVRDRELAELWRRLPDLEPEARRAIERMTRHLADRLLREPLERLGRDTDGRDGRAVRDLFAL